MCERVLESIFELRKQARLVEELRCLKSSEAEAKFFVRLISDDLEKRERNILPDNGSRLEKPLLFRRKSVNPSSQHRLHCRWHLCALECFFQPITASLTH